VCDERASLPEETRPERYIVFSSQFYLSARGFLLSFSLNPYQPEGPFPP